MSQYKIAVVGHGGVGKSAFIIMYLQGTFMEDYDPTIEDSYRKQDTFKIGGDTAETCYLEIMDTAGQEEYSALRDDYMRTCDGFIILYSLVETQSFEGVDEFRNQILRVKDQEDVPIVLVGNKCDLENEREVTEEISKTKAKLWKVPHFVSSAKSNINVSEAFHEIVRLINKDMAKKKKKKKGTEKQKKKRKCSVL